MTGRRVTLFGRVYVWHKQQRPAPAGQTAWRWSLRAETDAERAARLDAVSVATDAARARAHAIGGTQSDTDATIARIDALHAAAAR